MRSGTVAVMCLVTLCLGAGAVARFGPLPPLEPRGASTAPLDMGDTKLGKVFSPMVAAHPGLSGIYPLLDARDAFAARELLIRNAERTLDISYYIWRNDVSGTLLLVALCSAA